MGTGHTHPEGLLLPSHFPEAMWTVGFLLKDICKEHLVPLGAAGKGVCIFPHLFLPSNTCNAGWAVTVHRWDRDRTLK